MAKEFHGGTLNPKPSLGPAKHGPSRKLTVSTTRVVERRNRLRTRTSSADFGARDHMLQKIWSTKISRLRLMKQKNFVVGMTGIEPAHLAVLDPKSSASASSATSPCPALGEELYPQETVDPSCMFAPGSLSAPCRRRECLLSVTDGLCPATPDNLPNSPPKFATFRKTGPSRPLLRTPFATGRRLFQCYSS
jgi:hypothetical protein